MGDRLRDGRLWLNCSPRQSRQKVLRHLLFRRQLMKHLNASERVEVLQFNRAVTENECRDQNVASGACRIRLSRAPSHCVINLNREDVPHHKSRRVILVPESERSPMSPLFVITNTSTGCVVVVVST